MSPKIPLFTIEEHHEAFYIWSNCYHQGLIKPFGNTLLHVDAHDDMCVMGFRSSLDELGEDLDQIHNFVYSELGIADFIIPAVYQGLFNTIAWLSCNPASLSKKRHMFVASAQPEGKFLKTAEVNYLTRPYLEKEKKKWGKHQFFTFQEIGLSYDFRTSQPLVLDIDLDYFASDNSLSSVEKKIEITQAAYEEFSNNKYHFFRIMPTASYTVAEENGRFYLHYLEMQEERRQQEVPAETIVKRIHSFGEFLTRNRLKPELIDLCRSRYSGYTPKDQWQFIEKELLKVLQGIYDLKIINLQDLITTGAMGTDEIS
ncbi:MAG: UPF0489 family protein [Clostridia bacterium]|jgi:hypothetical protein|nr:UPF0489 family protein [Clostridia bacterium]